MTQKEKLITELFELNRQYYANEGTPNKWNDTPDAVDYYRFSRGYKVYELQQQIERKKKSIQQQETRMKRDAYFATEEGQKEEQALNKRRDELEKLAREYNSVLHTTISDHVRKYIGEDFICCSVSIGYERISAEIGLKDPERPKRAIFGHDFSIYYGRKYGEDDERHFEMNYGTLGSFDIMQDEKRVAYLQGMAKFASDKDLHAWLKNLFDWYLEKNKEISTEWSQIESKLKNPFA